MVKRKLTRISNTKLILLSLVFSICCADSVAPKAKSLRKNFYGWKNISGTCRNQRHELLMARSFKPVTFKTEEKCRVVLGYWIDDYTFDVYQLTDDVTMDHVVSLKYAYEHGAKQWPKNKRSSFYNDSENLVLTGRKTNATKNYYAPDEWLPSLPKARCAYVQKWDYIAKKYALVIEKNIAQVIQDLRVKCTPGETRTPDHLVRSQALYPTELRAQ